ncbi:hypothetical protein HK405_013628 [Cladochytrium tenue]|nr:hypothetical protein HK405_013628 [Cladochytrium tenue]
MPPHSSVREGDFDDGGATREDAMSSPATAAAPVEGVQNEDRAPGAEDGAMADGHAAARDIDISVPFTPLNRAGVVRSVAEARRDIQMRCMEVQNDLTTVLEEAVGLTFTVCNDIRQSVGASTREKLEDIERIEASVEHSRQRLAAFYKALTDSFGAFMQEPV